MEVSIVMGVHPIAGWFFLRENPSINGWFWGSHILMEIPHSISQQKLGELWLSSPPIKLLFFYCDISQYTIPMISPIWLVWIWYSHLKKRNKLEMFAPCQAASMELLTREGSTLVEEHWSMAGSTTVEPQKVVFFFSVVPYWYHRITPSILSFFGQDLFEHIWAKNQWLLVKWGRISIRTLLLCNIRPVCKRYSYLITSSYLLCFYWVQPRSLPPRIRWREHVQNDFICNEKTSFPQRFNDWRATFPFLVCYISIVCA